MNRLVQGPPEVISHVVSSINFSFYTDVEVHAISVKHITNPILFDNLRNPVPGGLYDPELGPIEIRGSCATCGQAAVHCPGHYGHIDLVLPVYNPLVYKMMIKIYRGICIFCHHFKMSRKKVALFAHKLELIAQGRLVAAMAIGTWKPKEPGDEEDDLADGDSDNAEEGNMTQGHQGQWTSSQISANKDVIDQFLKDLQCKKCENCKGHVPTIRNEGVGKIFQIPLRSSLYIGNILRGVKSITRFSVLDQIPKPEKGEEEANDEMDGTQETLVQTRSKGSKNKSGQGNEANSDVHNKTKFLTTSEVQEHLRLTWENEKRICSLIWGAQEAVNPMIASRKSAGADMFFLQSILVTPNRFRPPNRVDDNILEHPQNVFYGRLIQANISLTEASRGGKGEDTSSQKLDSGKATNLWLNLQNCVNVLLDSTTAIGMKNDQAGLGVRQLLEKKEGLFRMNMMGKRVNYACRSVISPDPYISVNEIGIPPYFATRLTYPERVTPWNVQQLRSAVENGPLVHPGATHVEDEQGHVTSLANIKKFKLSAISKTLLSTPGVAGTNISRATDSNLELPKASGKIVYRHLRDGDILLVNRQPTLHKPGVMAHRARVLKGEKTLRLHYANCSTYNADFDGDEMNVHFPQDELGRAEGYEIVNADQQYVVPTSGDPIRGLIQDHIISATLLTKRDTFLTKELYQQLVYAACVSSSPAVVTKKGATVGVVVQDHPIICLPPAILKPQPLWTGKQVLTTVFMYITHASLPFSMTASGKVPRDYWGQNSGESVVMFKDNELLCGAIDKAQFGKYGLVHAFQELYGASSAGQLLSVFSRLFTAFLQMHGFTCGVADLLLVPRAEKDRRQKLRSADKLGVGVHARFAGIDKDCKTEIDDKELKNSVERILQTRGDVASVRLDRMMCSALNGVTSDVNNALFPKGLLKPFPGNCFSLMTVTGAKGGLVNFTQISSLLGQQELEGKRVPRMASGKTLPCFAPWDTGARSGGFISDRFLTGLRPQEYYFHCMAGRDGLVDTAVKTSRSGYLQRCLMKNLEGLRVHYDYTVRDSDGSIVQFKYGEDGVDVTKTSYLTKFDLLAENRGLVSRRLGNYEMQILDHDKKQRDVESDTVTTSSESSFGGVSDAYLDKLKKFFKQTSKEELRRLNLRRSKSKEHFKYLMQLKFTSSLAPPGEPVGVLAAQSVGEPSTQMTLNTFHFAGRGEMNVTLGIPRLREILMTASEIISTPIMTCPLKAGKTREDAERLAMQLKKIRLVDLIENISVGEVPFSTREGVAQRVYKIKMRLYPPTRYPQHLNLGLDECEYIILQRFIPRLDKEIKSLSRSKNTVIGRLPFSELGDDMGESTGGADEDDESNVGKKRQEVQGEQVDDDEEDDAFEEEGADAEKRKGQGTDERGYDDEEDDEEKIIARRLQDSEDLYEEDKLEDDGVHEDEAKPISEDPNYVSSSANMVPESAKSDEKFDGNPRKVHGETFEMHFSVPYESPLLLMPEIVEKIAKQVSVREVRGIERCAVIDYKASSTDQPIPGIQTDGVNLEGFWALHDELDISRLTSNNIATMLKVYGVEAARATILSEVQAVFGSYGISVNSRHLSLIADFMTFQGGYRPCNRLGIFSSPSPFLKMSFETATVFLMDATLQSQRDSLESPSARIVMGRVVEIGTGCFNLLQNIDALIESKS